MLMKNDKNWFDPDDLERTLSKGRVYPLYYLYGNDKYLLDRGVKQIKTEILASTPERTLSTYSAGETSPSAIMNEARTLPFFSASRLIIVKEAHLFKPNHWREFCPYLENPVATTILLFLGEKMDLEKGVYDLIRKKGIIVRFNHPFETQLAQWIKRIAWEFEKEVTPEAVSFLREVVGNDLLRIRSELGKVSLYCQEEELIDVDAIKEVIAEAKVETVFPLIDCIGKKERDRSLEILWKLIEGGQPPLVILSLISRQIRLIAQGKEMIQKGKRPDEVIKILKVKGRTENFFNQLSLFSLDEIKDIFAKLTLTDLALKSSRLNKGIILERLILEMCR
jgi:DNA polymerase-3 subunit delta